MSAICAAMLGLGGCTLLPSTEDLYSLPQLSGEYVELKAQIQAIIDSGCQYAAPTSGENIQSVQMVDLTGDGTEDAVAFFRNSNDEKPLKIFIFKDIGTGYEQSAIIEGSGNSIDSINYSDIDGDSIPEIIVGWKMSTEKALAVYSLKNMQPVMVVEAGYSKYSITDLNADGKNEIITIHSDNEGGCRADAYTWVGTSLEMVSSARLSISLAGLSKVTVGALSDGSMALFVTGTFDESDNATDILILRDLSLTNITLSNFTGVTSLVYQNRNLYPKDINADGIMEVPVAKRLPRASEGDAPYWEICWNSYNSAGAETTVITTFHNITDGWYITLPDTWIDHITVSRVESVADERTVTFAYIDDNGIPVDFMCVSTLTGDSREALATRGKRFVLRTRTSSIYAAEFLDGYKDWPRMVTEDEIKASFNLIQTEWKTGD